MKIRLTSAFILLIMFMFSCNPSKQPNIAEQIQHYLNRNKDTLEVLTTNYYFKMYPDGVGRDLAKPIPNDTIIILKNNFTSTIKIHQINYGKVKLLDSAAICELSYSYDTKHIIMRSFLELLGTPPDSITKFSVKTWVPQYMPNNKHQCVLIENR